MRFFRIVLLATASVAGLVFGIAAPVAAQTTSTTIPPVRSIPVTPAAPTTTAAPSTTTAATGATAAAPLADTGIAADKLVPLGFALIGAGAVLQAGARRRRVSFVLG